MSSAAKSTAAKSTAAKGLSIAALLAAGALSQIGCRACCTPYDYSSPVVSGDCDSCVGGHHGRKGSISSHYAEGTPTAAGPPTEIAELPAVPLDGVIR